MNIPITQIPKKIVKKSKYHIQSILQYSKIRKNNYSYKNSGKALIITASLRPLVYHRYFYTLLKFFSIEGYDIFVPEINYASFKRNFVSVSLHDYFPLALKEGLICFGKVPDQSKYQSIFELNDKNLSHDYFTSLAQSNDAFHIPMSMHPLFYHNNYWSKEVDTNNRKKSLFVAGNLDRNGYNAFPTTTFNMASRPETIDYLLSHSSLNILTSKTALTQFLDNSDDKVCVIIDSSKNRIEMPELRPLLGKFYFYLALPGVVMPFSHNLIEALSVGAIPIIHKNYAKLMRPKLEHMKNALFYEDLDDLGKTIESAFQLDDDTISKMVSNVNHYYQNNLTPKSVINNLISAEFSNYYLQAEHASVDLYQKASTTCLRE